MKAVLAVCLAEDASISLIRARGKGASILGAVGGYPLHEPFFSPRFRIVVARQTSRNDELPMQKSAHVVPGTRLMTGCPGYASGALGPG